MRAPLPARPPPSSPEKFPWRNVQRHGRLAFAIRLAAVIITVMYTQTSNSTIFRAANEPRRATVIVRRVTTVGRAVASLGCYLSGMGYFTCGAGIACPLAGKSSICSMAPPLLWLGFGKYTIPSQVGPSSRKKQMAKVVCQLASITPRDTITQGNARWRGRVTPSTVVGKPNSVTIRAVLPRAPARRRPIRPGPRTGKVCPALNTKYPISQPQQKGRTQQPLHQCQ